MVASQPPKYLQPSHICNNDDNDHALGEEEWLPHDHLYICNQATSATMMIMTMLLGRRNGCLTTIYISATKPHLQQ